MKAIMIVFLVIFLSASGYSLYVMNQRGFFDDNNLTMEENIDVKENNNENELSITSDTKIGIVTKETFDEDVLKSDVLTLVDFGAEWCPACHELEPVMQEVSKEFQGVKFYSVDTDNDEDLASEYGIMFLPTVIAFSNGEEVDRFIGANPKENVESFIKSAEKKPAHKVDN
jgi:thioredoxin 1